MYSVYTSTINKASIPVYPVNTFEAPVSNSIVTDIDTRQTKGYKNHQVDHIDVSDTNEHKQNSQGDDGTNASTVVITLNSTGTTKLFTANVI